LKRTEDSLVKVNTILDEVARSLGIERGIKEITLINFWPEVVDERFINKTKAISVISKRGYDTLFVAVSSSSVSQELFFIKRNILSKLSPIAFSLGFKIKDIIFDTKIWDEINKENNNKEDEITHFFVKNPKTEDLKDISVPESIVDSIKESIESQNFSIPELKDRILNTVIIDIKTQIWRKNNGFPSCSKCGIPINYYSQDKENLCPICKLL
jgi:hypothetical protein